MWVIGISKGKDFPAWGVLITKSEELYDRILSLKKNINVQVVCQPSHYEEDTID